MAPFRDVFSALFFVSIGMLFDPARARDAPGMLAARAGRSCWCSSRWRRLRSCCCCATRVRTALTVAVGLAQIGEFSFILAALGTSLGMLPPEGTNLLVATAIISIALNPLLFRALPWIERRFERAGKRRLRRRRPRRRAPEDAEPVVDHRVGRARAALCPALHRGGHSPSA